MSRDCAQCEGPVDPGWNLCERCIEQNRMHNAIRDALNEVLPDLIHEALREFRESLREELDRFKVELSR